VHPDLQPAWARRRRRRSWLNGITLGLATMLLGAAGLVLAADSVLDGAESVDALASGVLTASGGGVENYLLVGSDTREGLDPTSPDAGGIGTTADVQGRRSDTVMVLRYDRDSGDVALVSLPRDLWVEIPGHGSGRINGAYAKGPDVLVRTVQESLGLPIHHYLEVDFQGFKDIVDAVGGVEVCFLAPARDAHTGLDIPEAGCHVLDGVRGLAFARSRYFESLVDGEWVTDPTSDLGRTQRQRLFVQSTLEAAIDRVGANPFRAGELAAATTAALRTDPDLDLAQLALRLRPVADGGIASYSLPVVPETIDGAAVLRLGDGADAVLAYFRGDGPAPVAS
jgi:LCP family protein required for cell wall assembly